METFFVSMVLLRWKYIQRNGKVVRVTVLVITGDVNTLRPRQDDRHFADDIFKNVFLNENVLIWLQISLKFVPKVRINNIPELVQVMAWRRSGDKPLSEPMMVSLLTHICVTRPQWVKACLQRLQWIPCKTLTLTTFPVHRLVTGRFPSQRVISHWYIPLTKGRQCGDLVYYLL